MNIPLTKEGLLEVIRACEIAADAHRAYGTRRAELDAAITCLRMAGEELPATAPNYGGHHATLRGKPVQVERFMRGMAELKGNVHVNP